ncbi:MAG: hypothetical protein ACI9SE_004703 [Neolewinella sp.]|jgi:hypothetical protein
MNELGLEPDPADLNVPGLSHEQALQRLAHNMSTPPKSVVSFEGLGALTTQHGPGGSGAAGVRYNGRSFFGMPVRFALRNEWLRLRTPGFLRLIEPGSKRRSPRSAEAHLHQLIQQRADELPLPEGCVTIPSDTSHPVLWHDALSMLAILTKCSTTVWLRRKMPSLLAALEQRSVSLLVPPAFVYRLPTAQADPNGGNHGH